MKRFYTSYQCTKKGERSLKNNDIKINLSLCGISFYGIIHTRGKGGDNTRIQTNKHKHARGYLHTHEIQ